MNCSSLQKLKTCYLCDYNFKKNKTNQGYFLKCDVTKHFQSIDHKILVQYFKKSGLDSEDMWFIYKLLESRYSENGIGLPIGNQTSQWFGLF